MGGSGGARATGWWLFLVVCGGLLLLRLHSCGWLRQTARMHGGRDAAGAAAHMSARKPLQVQGQVAAHASSAAAAPGSAQARAGASIDQAPPGAVVHAGGFEWLPACLGGGQWVETDAYPYLDYADQCPQIQANYICPVEHMQAIGRFKYVTPSECPLKSIEQARLGAPGGCLAGKKLSIVGDSLVHQLLHSLECRAGKHLLSRRITETYPFKGAEREKKVLITFANNMTIEYVFIGNNANPREHPLNKDIPTADIWKLLDRDADVVATNLGVFHYSDLEYKREERTAKIVSYGPELARAKGQVAIIGASAKHVNDKGYHKCGDDGVSLSWLEHWSEKQVEGLISNKNRALRWMAREQGFHFVDQESVTRARLDAHVSDKDCSHYCLPGIPDIWADLLITQLCGGAP